MKVVPQIVVFFLMVSIGWYAYEKHAAFRALVKDIAEYSGLSQPTKDSNLSKSGIATTISSANQARVDVLAEPAPVINPEAVIPEVPKTPAEISTKSASEEQAMPLTEPSRLAVQGDKAGEEIKDQPVFQPSDLPNEVPDQFVSESTSIEQVPKLAPAKPASSAEQKTSLRKQNALTGLQAARNAWHDGMHDKSVMIYGQLIQKFKNHPDFPGELGNIYFSRGQTALAVNAYSEAFLRLLRNNDFERARLVLGIIYNIDKERAILLREYFAP